MSTTPAQIAANIANAQASTGPRTPDGKSTCAKNAITHGLFTTRDFIRPGEESLYEQNRADLLDQLAPAGILECSLADEIHRALWRLRRCGEVEAALVQTTQTTDAMQDEAAARTQHSVDRARAQAHRLLHKCTAELRRLQTERHFRNEYFEAGSDLSHLGIADFAGVRKAVGREIANRLRQHKLDEIDEMAAAFDDNRRHIAAVTRQTQSPEQTSAQIARNASCPCNSGQKYKRCCGKNAPAILHAA